MYNYLSTYMYRAGYGTIQGGSTMKHPDKNVNPETGDSADPAFLHELSRIFISNKSIDELLQKVLKLLRDTIPMERGMISVRDRETDDIFSDVSLGYSDEETKRGRYKVGEGIIGQVIDSGELCVVPSVAREPKFLNRTGARNFDETANIAFICVPIKIDGDTIGTISADLGKEPDSDFTGEIAALTTVSIMIAHAVNSRNELRRREARLEQENRLLKMRLYSIERPGIILGNSRAIREMEEKILMVAPTNSTVLITGESGTGKELVANAVHTQSLRKDAPFIKVNIASLPENLVESELFGFEKGAFTGAQNQKKGRFELANGGTIFLDEIGDLSQNLQVKLLRVLQERTIERIGGEKSIVLDVRVIAATHQDLENKIQRGEFRTDLYYRLNVFPIYAPALRDRKQDVVILSDHFLEKFRTEHRRSVSRISAEAVEMLTRYHWPGNVRELENCIERAVILCDGDTITGRHLPPSLQTGDGDPEPATLEEMVDRYQRDIIVSHLKATRGNIAAAARTLGTTKRILNYKVKQLEIDYLQYKEGRGE